MKIQWKPNRPKFVLAVFGLTAVIAAGIVWLILILHPLPPRTITMVTGPENSAFSELGKRYQSLLAQDGITLRLISSNGAVENLSKLNDPNSDVQLGFIESGMTTENDSPGLVSLGTLAYEPFCFFIRENTGTKMSDLKGKRLSIGPEGSDTRKLALELMKQNAVKISDINLLSLPPTEAAEELIQGRIDGAVILDGWQSPIIQRLARAEGITFLSFRRSDAYVALYPFLSKLFLPMGVADLAKNRPPTDITLIGTKTNLIIRRNLHPAIQYLLLETASEIHSRAQLFEKQGQFPAAETTDLPLSRHARHFYKTGRPFLQRYFPFWLAILMEQLLVLILPLVGVVYPVMNGLISLYQWAVQRRIFLIYEELFSLETAIENNRGKDRIHDLLHRLEKLKHRSDRMRLSGPYIPMLYSLRAHIDYVYQNLNKTDPIGPKTNRRDA